jgi:ubiquinone/menaquinone biosynthesis C-methylase UbiE
MPEEISRVKRSKKEASESYNRMSRWYDIMSESSEKKAKEKGLNKLNVQKGEKVLEIGFGTGHALLSLAEAVGNNGKVYGIDISEGMFNISKERVEKAGFSERVELSIGDANKLPFADNYFDRIFMGFTLELFDTPEIPVVLEECERVLKNEGHVSIVAMSKKGNGIMIKLYEWAHRNFERYVDCRPIHAKQSLQEAGFTILDASEISMWGLPVDIVLAIKK